MVISHYLALAADKVFEGSVELDESYFGRRRKGRRGRGAAGKVVVFGILKRNGQAYTVVVDNAKSDTLMPVIKRKIMSDSIVYTDSLSSYDKLDVSGFIHYHTNHSKEFADRRNHINDIGNFWNRAKLVLRKYNGIDRKSFPLFLKECESAINCAQVGAAASAASCALLSSLPFFCTFCALASAFDTFLNVSASASLP